MHQLFRRGFLALIGTFVLGMWGVVQFSNSLPAQAGQIAQMRDGVREQVLGVADSIENMIFRVAIPARFDDTVTFNKPISAPNLIESLRAGEGIRITNGVIPVITNEGILELQAGNGISVDGNKIASTITQGFTSLTAGDNISIDGNKITNTYTAPAIDYALSGWSDNGTTVTLSTPTDSVAVGSLTTGAITAGSLTTSGLALAGGLTVTSGNSLLPDTDLGSDIGSASHRFNNLWVANINSNSSQAFSGQSTFSYEPTSAEITQASLIINPTTSFADGQLLGLGIGGYQRALIDEDGDITLGYNSLTSAPASDYPLNIYGHSGTRVSFVDTSGNLTIGTGLNSTGSLTITPNAGSNLNIGLSTTGDFAINSNQLYVDTSTGYVGLGIATPEVKLDVVGNLYSSGMIAVASNQFLGVNGPSTKTDLRTRLGYGYVGITTGEDFSIRTNGADRIRISSGGNVGIGTTSPFSKLHVSGAVTGKALAIFDETGNQNILVASASGTNRFVITSAGNVGIGTISPSSKLSVDTQVRIWSGSETGWYGTLSHSAGGATSLTISNPYQTGSNIVLNGGTTGINFNVGGITRQFISGTGLVGIGTTSPTSKLHVSGAVTGKALAIFDETGDQNILVASASGTNRLILTSAGNLGIGTASPDQKLDVIGNLELRAAEGTDYLRFSSGSITQQGVALNINGVYLRDGMVGVNVAVPVTKLHVSGATTGKALAIFDETGNQNILVASASGTNRFVITSAGNVGVGTSSPTAGLQVASGQIFAPAGTSAAPGLAVGVAGAGIYYSSGHLRFNPEANKSVFEIVDSTNVGLQLTTYPLGWGSSMGANNDVSFYRDAAGILGQRAGATSQAYRIYNTYTDASNYERFVLDWKTTSNTLRIGTEAAGTGALRNISFVGGNVGIGTTTFGTDAAKVLAIAGSTAPTTAITDGIQLYAVDNAGSHELKVMDEAGNATTLSPHNFSLIESGPSEEMAWSYYSERDGLGVNVDMTKALRIVENISGEKLIFMKDLESGVSTDIAISTSSAVVSTKDFDLLKNIVETITQAIADIQTKILAFADKFRTKELCLGEEEAETCVTKTQLDELIKMIPSPSPSMLPSTSPIPTLAPSPESTFSATTSASF